MLYACSCSFFLSSRNSCNTVRRSPRIEECSLKEGEMEALERETRSEAQAKPLVEQIRPVLLSLADGNRYQRRETC